MTLFRMTFHDFFHLFHYAPLIELLAGGSHQGLRGNKGKVECSLAPAVKSGDRFTVFCPT